MKEFDLNEAILYTLAGAAMGVIAFIIGYFIAWSLYHHCRRFRDWVNNIRNNDSAHHN